MPNQINPRDPDNHNKIIWVVYGPDSFPTMCCCVIKTAAHGTAIWGYSVYKRSPGFRTIGRDINGGWIEEHGAKFFETQNDAFDYLREITTPRCDEKGNKIKKLTKKEQAADFLERLGVVQRTKIEGAERERLIKMIPSLTPISTSNSLHWWSDTYLIDGKMYDFGGPYNSTNVELVELINEIR